MKIKVMTFNMRVANGGDGINSFSNRKPYILETIKSESPELIGFQEITDVMREWICDNVEGYFFQGCGRESDCHGESMLLGYKKGVYELMKLDNVWLSATPDIPGSRFDGDQSPCPRMFTSVLLKRDGIDTPFYFINTHLDHVGEDARYLGSIEIIQYISRSTDNGRVKFILTGDFNALPDAREIKVFSTIPGISDCTEGLPGTFHGFGALTGDRAEKIDYIFTNGKPVRAYLVEDQHEGGIYYSDHFAICTYVDI